MIMSHGRSAGVTVKHNSDGSTKYTAYCNTGEGGDKGMRVSVTRDSNGNVTNVHSTNQNIPVHHEGRHD